MARFTVEEEKEIVAEYRRGEFISRIARKWDCRTKVIREVLIKYGAVPPCSTNFGELAERVIAEYNKGKTYREVAEVMGISVTKVCDIISANNIERTWDRRKNDLKRQIADGLRNGEKNQEIADRLGISRQYVSRLAIEMGFPKGHKGKPKKKTL